jgi:hypothetical protein
MEDPRLRSYLLGTLPGEEQRRLEEEYFRDEALFDALLEVAEDLAEAARRGELSRAERAAFERRVLASREWRARLEVTKALATTANRARLESPAVRPVVARRRLWLPRAAAAVAASAVLAVLAVRFLRPGRTIPPAAPPRRAISAPLDSPLRTRIAELALRAAISRDSGAAPVLHLAPDVMSVRLLLPLAAHRHQRYEAVLRTAEGTRVVKTPVEHDASPRLVAQVPAARLGPGDYIVTLQGSNPGRPAEDVADYSFRVAVK